jgi:hypothetical protein
MNRYLPQLFVPVAETDGHDRPHPGRNRYANHGVWPATATLDRPDQVSGGKRPPLDFRRKRRPWHTAVPGSAT